MIGVAVFIGGLLLVRVDPVLLPITWGVALAYAFYRIFADAGDVIAGWRSAAEQLGLSIEGDGSRLGPALQLTSFSPRLSGTLRGIRVKAYISSAGRERLLDNHDKSAWGRFQGTSFSGSSSSHTKGNVPVTVFEAPLTAQTELLDEHFVVAQLQRLRPNAALRRNSVAFTVRGLVDDPDEIIEHIEALVTSVERSYPEGAKPLSNS